MSLSILTDNLSGESTIVSSPNQPQMNMSDEQLHVPKKKRIASESSLNRKAQNDLETTLSAKTNIERKANQSTANGELGRTCE